MDSRTDIATSEVELVLDAHAELGEGPTWHAAESALVWVDITRCLVHRYTPASGRDESIDVGQHVGAAAPRAAGGLVLALRDGVGILDTATRRVEMIADIEADHPGNRMNDGKCDSAGRFWAGTMAYDNRPGAGALYRLETDRHVARVLSAVTISNGIGWSLDDRLMYYIDTPTLGVDVFDYEAATGAITNRRRLITIPPEAGQPDGMTVDSDGFLWVALWGGWAVHRYSPKGVLDRVVKLPVAKVTSCAFGGPDLADLYITSASIELSPDELREQPHAGGLFRHRPGVAGLPTHSFKG